MRQSQIIMTSRSHHRPQLANGVPTHKIAQGISIHSPLSPNQIHALQQTIGNQAVQRLIIQQVKAQTIPTITAGQTQLIQRVKDFDSSGVSRGSGLTPTANGPHGKWHIHVILDGEGLGLIDKFFIRFEERNLGDQHLMFDQDGILQETHLSKNGPQTVVQWGIQKVNSLFQHCTDVSPEQIEERRRAKEEKKRRDEEALAKLPPLKGPEKATYSGKQEGLFGSIKTTVSEEAATEMLSKVGITKSTPDFNMIKAKVKDGTSKDKWPSYIQKYYDQIYPPVLTTISEEIVSTVEQEKVSTTSSSQEHSNLPPQEETKPLMQVKGNEIAKVVTDNIKQEGNPSRVPNVLVQLGVPIVIVVAILAVILKFIF